MLTGPTHVQVRTALQATVAGIFTCVVLFFLDRNYRVLPNALHEYLPQPHNGLIITDIRITKCSSLNVFSSCTLDSDLWHRIEKDLYLGKSMSHAYVHIQRKREEELQPDDKIVVDVSVGRLDPGSSVKGQEEERWDSRGAGLWVKRTAKRRAGDKKNAVTAVDVLFGEDAVEARDGWAIKGTPLLLDGSMVAHVTVRTGSHQDAAKPRLRIGDNGKFKIVQLADLHLSTGVGHCRDAVPDSYKGGRCEADPRTLDFVARILEEERPDLVVLSGDQVNGETAPDAQTVSFRWLCPPSERGRRLGGHSVCRRLTTRVFFSFLV